MTGNLLYLAGVTVNGLDVSVGAVPVLDRVTLTVPGERMRTVGSGQQLVSIAVELRAEYLGLNVPGQTTLLLSVSGSNGVGLVGQVMVTVPANGSAGANFSLMLGDSRQTTVSFEVMDLPSYTRLDRPVLSVRLVSVPASVVISASPQAILDLDPHADATAEFRLIVRVQGSDDRPFSGLTGLMLRAAGTAVAGGDAGDLVFSSAPLEETAAGVYESTLRVTVGMQVTAASVEIGVDGVVGRDDSAGAVTVVQLMRPRVLSVVELELSATVLEQQAPGESVQTVATVRVTDQFGAAFAAPELRLRVVDAADGSEVLVTTQSPVFDAQGEAQLPLVLTPPRGRDQNLQVQVVGITDPELIPSSVAVRVIAVEVLSALTVTGPTTPLSQTASGEAVVFAIGITGVGSKGTDSWQQRLSEPLRLQHTTAPGVTVAYDPILTFGGAQTTVTVTVTPLPGTDADISFSVIGNADDLSGVEANEAVVSVISAVSLSKVTLTVPGERMRTVQSGQEPIAITVQVMTEYLGQNVPAQTQLQLRAVGSNGVTPSAPVATVVPTDGLGTASFSLMLGDARQSTVSFEVVGLPAGAVLESPVLSVELVSVPVSLMISVSPQAIRNLNSRGAAVGEFRVEVGVRGSDGRPFGGLSGLSLRSTVTEVVHGDDSHVDVSAGPFSEVAPGSHESRLSVSLSAERVSAATVEIAVIAAGGLLAGASTTVQVARPPVLDDLSLQLSATVLEQPALGAAVRVTATVVVRDQFGRPFIPSDLRLRVVDTADDAEVLVTEQLLFDNQARVQRSLVLTPPRGRDQNLRVELSGVTDAEVSTNAVAVRLIAVEVLDSLTLSGPSSMPAQMAPAEPVVFAVRVSGVGSKGTDSWQLREALQLQHTVSSGALVDYESLLTFRAGVATVTVTVTPLPGTDALVTFSVAGDPDDLAGVAPNPLAVTIAAIEVLSTVTLTVSGERMRTVESGQQPVAIAVQLMVEYLGENVPEQTALQLRVLGTNGLEALLPIAVSVPADGPVVANFNLMLGAVRQTTVSFEVVDLPSYTRFDSPLLSVRLVPVPVSVVISASPQAILDLEPRAEVTAEFRLMVSVRGSDDQPFGGLTDLMLRTSVTVVAGGEAADLVFSSAPLKESAAGVYESTLRVTVGMQITDASVEIGVDGVVGRDDPADAVTVVELMRPRILHSLELRLADTILRQGVPGEPVQTAATVLAVDQFGAPFEATGLQLSVVDTADGSEVLVTTPALVFDAGGEAQALLVLTPPRGQDQNLRVEVIGATDPEVISNPAAVQLIAVEVLGALTVTGPVSTQTQTMPDEAVVFAIGVTAVGSKGTDSWQQRLSEPLQLQHITAPGVKVAYEPILTFSGARSTVTVTVTPLPGTDAELRFSVTGNADDLIGVEASEAVVSVISAVALSTVTLTVQGELMRTVQSGQQPIDIAVQLMAEYLGTSEPEETLLQLRLLGSNGVGAVEPVTVAVPAGGLGTASFSLMLGDARQTTVSFEIVGLPAGAVLESPVLSVKLVPVPASLMISVSPQTIGNLEPRAEVLAEFRLTVTVQGSDGQPIGGFTDFDLGTTVTEVVHGDEDAVDVSYGMLAETAAGVYESTLRVTFVAEQVSAASVEVAVVDVGASGLVDASASVQLARALVLDRLELTLMEAVLLQAEAGEAVQTTAEVLARDQFGQPFMPTGLRLSVVDAADGLAVLVTDALLFDALGMAQSVLSLTPPPGRDQNLRVELSGVTDPEVSSNTATLELIAVEILESLTVLGPSSQQQTEPAQPVSFEVVVAAVGSKGTPSWQPGASLRLQHTVSPGGTVDYDPMLMFSDGMTTVTVTATPLPGTDALVTFRVTGDLDDLAGVDPSPLAVTIAAIEVLSTVTLTVPGELVRTVESGQDPLVITVQLMAEYLGENVPEQTTLQLRARGSNGVEASALVKIAVPSDGFVATELSLMLGAARQSTVSFEVVELPAYTHFDSPLLSVQLVPVPVAVVISASPQAVLDLAPRADATAEFRLMVSVQGSNDQPFGGLTDLMLRTTVTAVAGGEAADLAFLSAALKESAAGVYESTLRVTVGMQITAASVEIGVDGVAGRDDPTGAVTVVELMRPRILHSLELRLSETVLEQRVPGESLQTTATVVARDQFGDAVEATGLQLSVVAAADGSEVLLTTPALVFAAGGEAQSLLVLTPPRGQDQELQVQVVGVTDPEVIANAVAVQLIAVEVLGALTVTGPASTQTQTMPAEAVVFDISVTAVGSKGTDSWQQRLSEPLQLQHTTAPGVTVVYDPILTFSGAETTVTVMVTPLPGIDAELRFSVAGNADDLIGVEANEALVSVISAVALSTVTLTVQGELMRTVQSGQQPIDIEVQLMAEYLGGAEPEETLLQLRVLGSNGVGAVEPVTVAVPAGDLGMANFSLMLGDARQTTVSFEIVGLPAGAVLESPVLSVKLVPVPASLMISVSPQTIGALEPRAEVLAEFRLTVTVQGSDGQPFGDFADLQLGTTVTEVADGDEDAIDVSYGMLAETAAGVYESTLRVTFAAEQVSAASVEVAVVDVGASGLAGASTSVRLARALVVDRLELTLMDAVLSQAEAGEAVQTTAEVVARNQFGRLFMPTGLRLSVVDAADGLAVLVTEELLFDAQGRAQSLLSLTPPLGRDQNLRVELSGVTDPEVSSNTATLELIAVEILESLTVLGPSSQQQSRRAQPVSFDLLVTAVGSKGTPSWQPGESLRLQHTVSPGGTVDYDPMLMFMDGMTTVTVTVTPLPGTDALVIFRVTGDADALAGVSSNTLAVSVGAVEVLSTVTLTVRGELMRTVESGQDPLVITVQLMAEYLGENVPEQTTLQLRAQGSNGVEDSALVMIAVPSDGFVEIELSLMLGAARQSTVSFEVVELSADVNFDSPVLRVELVPVPVSVVISALPQAILDLEPRAEATAEFRLMVSVQGSDDQPFGGLTDLMLRTTVTAVAGGEAGDLTFLSAALKESAAGVYVSTLRVTVDARITSASVEIGVDGVVGRDDPTGAVTVVELVRPRILHSLELRLSATVFEQRVPGESLQTTATVVARDQFGGAFPATGLQLSVVDAADGSEVLLTTPALVFDAGGEVRVLLVLTPPRGQDQELQVQVVGVTDPELIANSVAVQLIAVEVLGALTVTGPASTQTQTMPAEAVVFDITVTAVGSKGTDSWQQRLSEPLQLQHTTAPGVTVVYDPILTFSGAQTTVTVMVTPLPGTNAELLFSVTGNADDLIGVEANEALVSVISAVSLSTVTLTVPGELMRTVESGQQAVDIEVQLMAEYLGGAEPEETLLQLRVLGSNGVGAVEPVTVAVPAGGLGTASFSLMLGDARQTTVSFEIVGLPAGAVLESPVLSVKLVPVPASLMISVSPQTIGNLQPRAEVLAEFRLMVTVQGSDGQPFGNFADLQLGTTVTEVADGNEDAIDVSYGMLAETAAGVYESTLRVTFAAEQISAANVEVAVVDVGASGLAGASTSVRLARALVVDRLELTLMDAVLSQAEAGEAVQTTAEVVARNQFGRLFMPTGLRLSVVDAADGLAVLVTDALLFDAQGRAQSLLSLTPPPGRDQSLRVELSGVTDPEVSSNTVTLELIAVEILESLTVLGPSSQQQSRRAQPVSFDLLVTAVGSKGTPWQPGESLLLQHTVSPGGTVDYEPMLMFMEGMTTVTVTVIPLPGTDALVTFCVGGDADVLAGVSSNTLAVSVGAVEVLSTVTLTVRGELMRTVESGQDPLVITVQLMAEYLGENVPEQTTLQLRVQGSNGVEDSALVKIAVPSDGFVETELSLMLGAARQSTVSFEVVELPAYTRFDSPLLSVELVPVPVAVVISASPQAVLDLEPRADATAEFRLMVSVQGSDDQPFGGLTDLMLRTTVTAVAGGEAGDLAFLSAALKESAAGVYVSTLRVTVDARITSASVEIGVDGVVGRDDPTGAVTVVELMRPRILHSLELRLSATVFEQRVPGESLRTTATVVARDQFGAPFTATGLQLSVVAAADGSEVLLTTPALVFDAGGEAQSLLVLTPPRGQDQELQVRVVGVTDPELIPNSVAVRLTAVEVLSSLVVAGPVSTQTQTMPGELLVFAISVTAVSSEGTLWNPMESLELRHMAVPGAVVDYDRALIFRGGVATVTVTVTPLPGTDALLTFSVAGGDSAALAGVTTNRVTVSVVAAEVLGRVVLTVLDGAEQFILTKMFSIVTELSLEPSGNRPLSAETTLTVLIRASVGSGGQLDGPAVFAVPISGVTPGRVEITGSLFADSFATTVSLTIDDGVPAGVPTVILPTATVTVIARANLDVDGSGQIDAADGVLIMQYLFDSLAEDTRSALVLRLEDLLHPKHPDRRRLDLNNNGAIDGDDARILLRYLAGLRNGSLGTFNAETEQRLKAIIEAGQ